MKMHEIYVYNDIGMSKMSLDAMMKSLDSLVDKDSFNVTTITAVQINDDKLKDSFCLVIGGGYDLGFIKALGIQGMLKIKEYVEQGGRYLGVCAGAYFACNRVVFDKGGKYEVIGERWLRFFNGDCVGPEYEGYVPNSELGSKAAPVITPTTESFKCYYNGGGRFQEPNSRTSPSTTDSNTYSPLAYYGAEDTGDRHVAVVACEVQKGMAILSGIHCEYEYENPGILADIRTQLKDTDQIRKHFFVELLNRLNIGTLI